MESYKYIVLLASSMSLLASCNKGYGSAYAQKADAKLQLISELSSSKSWTLVNTNEMSHTLKFSYASSSDSFTILDNASMIGVGLNSYNIKSTVKVVFKYGNFRNAEITGTDTMYYGGKLKYDNTSRVTSMILGTCPTITSFSVRVTQSPNNDGDKDVCSIRDYLKDDIKRVQEYIQSVSDATLW